MSGNWKIDLESAGACFAVSKELASALPDFSSFAKEYYLPGPSQLTAEDSYIFFLSLLRSSLDQLKALEIANNNLTDTLLNYRRLLEQQQNKAQPAKSQPALRSSPNLSSLDVLHSNISRWRKSATIIQAFWRGLVARRRFKDKLFRIINETKPRIRSVSNREVMEKICLAIEKKGLSLEQCYRAADIDCNGKLTFEELLKLFNDLKLNLPRSAISRFMLIIDEDCSGVIDKSEFNNALAAYKVDKERPPGSKSYEDEILLKFIKVLRSRQIEAEEIFNMCDTDSSGTISLKELEKHLLGLKAGFQQKEVHALILRLDTDNSGELSLEEFKQMITKGHAIENL